MRQRRDEPIAALDRNRLAHLLRAHGLERLDHYSIFMENHERYVEVCAAGERSGLYYTCVNSYLTADEVGDGISIVQLIVRSGLAASGKEAKRLIADNGARLDDEAVTDPGLMLDAGRLASPVKLSAGRKRHALVQIA